MSKLIWLLLFILSLSSPNRCIAKDWTTPHVVGHMVSLDSKILNQNRQISVYLPPSYYQENAARIQQTNRQNNQHYPVMYVLDGQRYFLQAIAYQQALTFQDKSPEFIVIGIQTNKRTRRQWLGAKADDFIGFLKTELLPYVAANYRTNEMKLLFGWEAAAGFALESLAKAPSLFDGYFVSSPTGMSQNRRDAVKSMLSNNKAFAGHFYFAIGSVETWATDSTNGLSQIFDKSGHPGLKWHYDLSVTDDHYTTPFDTFNKGLKWFFDDYPPIRFYSIKAYRDYGGIEPLRTHYKKRGKRYQIDEIIHPDTIHYLFNQSFREDDYATFTELVAEFKGFIANHYDRAWAFARYGNFHLTNGQIDAAIAVLKSGLLKLPDAAQIHGVLGDVYLAQNKKRQAKLSYQKAVELSVESKQDLAAYQTKLNAL